MLSHTEENYLKEIYLLEENFQMEVNTNALAQKLQSQAASVTDMFRKLSKKELVVYRKYKGVRLSEKGKAQAISIIRKHRLWETFLVEKLNFQWDEVHDIAEQLEHINSEKLTQRLEAFLGYPKVDPHGDPIPNSSGQFVKLKSKSLAELKIKEEGILITVKDSSDDFLKYLDKRKLGIGDKIKVLDIEPFDKSVRIANNSQELIISEHVAKNLYISL